jgi:hypothetical protein
MMALAEAELEKAAEAEAGLHARLTAKVEEGAAGSARSLQ